MKQVTSVFWNRFVSFGKKVRGVFCTEIILELLALNPSRWHESSAPCRRTKWRGTVLDGFFFSYFSVPFRWKPTRWWFQILLSSPLFGEKIPIWTNIFHPGLKPPTRNASIQYFPCFFSSKTLPQRLRNSIEESKMYLSISINTECI